MELTQKQVKESMDLVLRTGFILPGKKVMDLVLRYEQVMKDTDDGNLNATTTLGAVIISALISGRIFGFEDAKAGKSIEG